MQEWYLLSQNTRPNVTGGFENDMFVENKDDAFAESLETDIAVSVILYNSDLSKGKNIRCIVQGNTADTQLKSLERTVLFSIGTVKAGMYVFFENRYWLINGYPGNNGIYEKATMVLCQYLLRWQNSEGKIIDRWCNAVSASKYDVGENGNYTITLSSNTYTILTPGDSECLNLDRKRVFIDKRKINPEKVFKMTRTDDILYDYGDEYHGSVLSFIADKTELNLKTDSQELGICDYIDIDHSEHDNDKGTVFAKIIGSDSIKINRKRTYYVKFYSDESCTEEIECTNYTWHVSDDIQVKKTIYENSIEILISDEQYIGKILSLKIISNSHPISEKKIEISNLF